MLYMIISCTAVRKEEVAIFLNTKELFVILIKTLVV